MSTIYTDSGAVVPAAAGATAPGAHLLYLPDPGQVVAIQGEYQPPCSIIQLTGHHALQQSVAWEVQGK